MYIDFEKYTDGLVPAVVQDANTRTILMVGFMNGEALEQTRTSGNVTFYSRSREKLWVKGETSGNFLRLVDILVDCDNDTLLIKATPSGPACHTGSDTCFKERNPSDNFLLELERIITNRKNNPRPDSYTSRLLAEGSNKIAQKVGEEAVELVIEAVAGNNEKFTDEAADLLYHLLVLLASRDLSVVDVIKTLESRHRLITERNSS
jgi:phosphoribosyl-AMP cyclohydrolase / phosphoribosyl-ATP pyrophosphohydrolase